MVDQIFGPGPLDPPFDFRHIFVIKPGYRPFSPNELEYLTIITRHCHMPKFSQMEGGVDRVVARVKTYLISINVRVAFLE